jgi:DNA-directed RNA polymerase alpha subunit
MIRWGRREFDRNTNKNQELVDENIVLREQNRLLVQQLNDISSQLKSVENLKQNSKDITEIIGEVDVKILKLLSTPIEYLNLSVRTENCLKFGKTNHYNSDEKSYICYEIKSLGDILHHYKNKNLLKMRNFGRKSFTELEDILEKYGLIDYYGNILN